MYPKTIFRKFDFYDIETIIGVVKNNPDKLEVLNILLAQPELLSKEIIQLFTSEKISIEELRNIQEYITFSKEKGFNLIKLLESNEEDFNNFILRENQRLESRLPQVVENNLTFKIVETPSKLINQLRQFGYK